jgi:hypothetical protein
MLYLYLKYLFYGCYLRLGVFTKNARYHVAIPLFERTLTFGIIYGQKFWRKIIYENIYDVNFL